MLSSEEIARIDREFLRAQERDRMSERSQIWTVFISLASAFGFIATQSNVALLTGMFPLLLYFLALHVENSEDTLKQIRKYLYLQERDDQGYEHFVRSPEQTRSSHGGYKKALRGAFALTQVLATASVMAHLVVHQTPLVVVIVVAIVEIAATLSTWFRLSNRKRRQPERSAP